MTYKPENAWAAAWSDGSPEPFILTHTTRGTRVGAQQVIGEVWARDGETWQQGWKRAYRKGCRCIRVCVSPADKGLQVIQEAAKDG